MMDQFQHVFSFIGLLLGLSLVEVLTGLSKVYKARHTIKVGWLTPLLGILVVLEITSLWGIAWTLRDHLPRSIWQTLGGGVLLSGAFYVAASAVLPRHPEQCPDLDTYYWQNKRTVLVIMIFCTLALYAITFALGRPWSLLETAINVPVVIGLSTAYFSKSRVLDALGIGFVVLVLVVNFTIP